MRRDQMAKQVFSEGSGTFVKLGSLRSLDGDWVCGYLSSTVGFTAKQLVAAKSADDDALVNLLCHDAQIATQAPCVLARSPYARLHRFFARSDIGPRASRFEWSSHICKA